MKLFTIQLGYYAMVRLMENAEITRQLSQEKIDNITGAEQT
jgi:hypothetical protein